MNHRRCEEVVEIENIKEPVQCNELSKMLRIAIAETKTAIGNLEEADLHLSDDINDVENKLSNLRSQILQSFDDFANNVTQKAKTYRDGEKGKWASTKVECETEIKAMNTKLKTLEDIIEQGTPSQQFVAMQTMERSIHNEITEHKTLCKDLKKLAVTLKFNEIFEHFKYDLMGKLNSDEFEINYRVPRKSRLKQIASKDLKQADDDVGEPFYTGLDFMPDGRVVTTDNKNGKCCIYDEKLNRLSTFKLPYIHPQCIAVISDKGVVITTAGEEYRKMIFLQVSQSHKMTLNRTVNVDVEYYSINMMNDKEAVVSTIDHDTPVRIVSMSGEEKVIDIAFPSKKYPIGKSSIAYIRGKHKLVLTDTDEDLVFIYDMESGERIVVKHELIKKPRGTAVGPYDHVFVGMGSTSTSIVEMTHTGTVLLSIDVGMKYPRTICISRDRKRLAVSNGHTGHSELKLYEILSSE